MPNWCYNRLTIRGNKNALNDFKTRMKEACETKVEPREFTFTLISRLPDALKDTTSPRPLSKEQIIHVATVNHWTDNELTERLKSALSAEEEARLDALKLEYGADNWYDWKCNNWGTKWDAVRSQFDGESDDSIVYSFETAWNPPEQVVHGCAKMFPNLQFELEYSIEGEDDETEDRSIIGDASVYEKVIEFYTALLEIKTQDKQKVS